jgi:hypothetical protein
MSAENGKYEVQDTGSSNPVSEEKPEELLPAAHSDHGASDTPNGGLVAWIQVASAFCLFFNTW